MEEYTIIESFFILEDAVHFFDQHMREMSAQGWELQEGSQICYVNYQYRAGLKFSKKVEKDVQFSSQ